MSQGRPRPDTTTAHLRTPAAVDALPPPRRRRRRVAAAAAADAPVQRHVQRDGGGARAHRGRGEVEDEVRVVVRVGAARGAAVPPPAARRIVPFAPAAGVARRGV